MQNVEQGSQSIVKHTLSKLHLGGLNQVAEKVLENSGQIALGCGLLAIGGHVALEFAPLNQAVFSHLTKSFNRFLSDTFNQDLLILQKSFMATYILKIASKFDFTYQRFDLSEKDSATIKQLVLLQAAETTAHFLGLLR
ncbi:hypothetical protein KC660_03255 [Candidatus Dojkabacteria bacterium]|uniref:Uncharacterized protein n=1 Tax=Candidatus Dojkabacteria bacterium TaxID=2099670 RepID=A0A955L3X6_9BACT|nr:hypothetical protein [Candidatus Dojkabacteria bacterium]